jgi:hypothetical protein
VIKRVDRGRSHWYVDEETGQRVPGVTSITDAGVPKPALINWAGSSTAEYAIDHWDELAELEPTVRLKTLERARYLAVDKAKNKGTLVHKIAERLVHGDRVAIPEGLEGHVESYVRFLDEYDVQPILVERTVHSAQYGYCGTLDLIADLIDPDDPEPDLEKRQRWPWLIDIKTGRSGIFGDVALQLAAYRYADVWIDPDEPAEHEMPAVEYCGGLHIRADGYDLIPVEAGELQHRQFLYVWQVGQFMDTSRELIGAAIEPPHTSTYRLVREDT